MAFWDLFKRPAADAAATLIGSVTTAIDEIVTNKEERAQLQMAAQKQVQDYTIKMEELAQASEKVFIEDKQNARDMQKAALMQNDLFSKRFVYYLAIAVLLFTAIWDYTVFFKTIADTNKDLVMFISGVINTAGFGAIMQFFFGSSKGSSDKQDKINELMDKK